MAVVVHSLAGGGAERVALDLATRLADCEVSVDLVAGRMEGRRLQNLSSKLRPIDLDVRRVRFALPALARYFRSERPRVALTFGTDMNALAVVARAIAGYPNRLVLSERVHLSAMVEAGEVKWLRSLSRIVPFLYRRADAIVAVSNPVAEDLAARFGIPESQLTVIPNFVDGEELQRRAAASSSPHRWFDVEGAVVVSAGRLVPQKDFPTLIQAIGVLRDRSETVNALILGEGDEEASLRRLVDILDLKDRVEFCGFVDPVPYVSRATAFVLPSKFEGHPNVLLEAIALGTPIVATDSPGGTKSIMRAGEFGVLVPVSDAIALANAISSVCRSAHRPGRGFDGLEGFDARLGFDRWKQLLAPTGDGL